MTYFYRSCHCFVACSSACSVAKDKQATFILSVIRSRMLPSFISDVKDKHPTFIFSVIRSRMLPSFISDRKKQTPDIYFSVIRRRMVSPFISDAKDKHPTFILASYGDECYRHSFPTLRQTRDIYC